MSDNLTQDRRLELHEILVDVLGSKNVYFQPPESLKIKYPAIIYHQNGGKTKFSNNGPYVVRRRYTLTFITNNPDDDTIRRIAYEPRIPGITYDRHYTKDGLNYEVYSLFY